MAKREQNASRFGLESVHMEMLRGQIRTIDQVLTNFVTEKEKLGAESALPRASRCWNGRNSHGTLRGCERIVGGDSCRRWDG